MPHLPTFRTGWENENLGLYFLYQFAFVARPWNVADDVGVDYFCTLFEHSDKNQLLPKQAFAIQIKSNDNDIRNDEAKVNYYNDLGMPFFIGVVDRTKHRMDVYSGEYIQHFAPLVGNPLQKKNTHHYRNENSRLLFRTVNEHPAEGKYWLIEGNDFVLVFPYIGSISVANEVTEVANLSALIRERCTFIQGSISSRKASSFVLAYRDASRWQIYSGPDSARTFRANFCLRLAEVFSNLGWLHRTQSPMFRLDEFRRYELMLSILGEDSLYTIMPEYGMASRCYDSVRGRLEVAGIIA